MPAAPGSGSPYKTGDFVVCNFPYREAPDEPGPQTHIALCLGHVSGHALAVVAAYTSSQLWPVGAALPRGVRHVPEHVARLIGQRRAFMIDARKIAFLPLNASFFPELERPGHGKVGESTGLANAVLDDLVQMRGAPGLIVQLGPLRPER